MVLTSMYGVIPNKSLRIEFPTYIPRQHLKHLVRGYFDGDGGVVYVEYKRKNRNNTIGRAFHSRFTSGSRVFLKELHKQLQAAKIVTGGSLQVKPGGGFELAFAAYDSIALFEFMYKNVSYRYYLERKRNAFYNIIQLWN
ncbi:MAG: hypothetical protein UY09_C0002G0001 [Parcubacteria group bacterium GW2011_GWA2_47_8]|nr:MAG: hypothetical protein UY09_C0002G0001 [Parcubacteria group bacterium GW2011_GWA2_47_8]